MVYGREEGQVRSRSSGSYARESFPRQVALARSLLDYPRASGSRCSRGRRGRRRSTARSTGGRVRAADEAREAAAPAAPARHRRPVGARPRDGRRQGGLPPARWRRTPRSCCALARDGRPPARPLGRDRASREVDPATKTPAATTWPAARDRQDAVVLWKYPFTSRTKSTAPTDPLFTLIVPSAARGTTALLARFTPGTKLMLLTRRHGVGVAPVEGQVAEGSGADRGQVHRDRGGGGRGCRRRAVSGKVRVEFGASAGPPPGPAGYGCRSPGRA